MTRTALLLEEIAQKSPFGGSGSPRGTVWVARILGRCARYGLAREFVKPEQVDYTRATRFRGVFLLFLLEDGLYEIKRSKNRMKTMRYFIRVLDGETQEISKDEAWKSAGSE